jgi:manganese/zinc/iron transport system permease protein
MILAQMPSLLLSVDVPAVLAAVLSACVCALLGNFLLLRKMAMLGDAISHAILPGIVISFLLLGTRSTPAMLAGAAAAGVLTAVIVEVVRRLGRVEAGAAIGVVFSAMFALGVVLMERAARNVDLDADCVLYGALESIRWGAATSWASLGNAETWLAMPRQVTTLLVLGLVSAAAVVVFFKHLRLACFDSAMADALGFPSWIIHTGLTVLVAAATVASFEAVGSILVVSMLVCPPAAARHLTDRLSRQVVLSVIIAGVCAVSGYVLAIVGPKWVGFGHSLQAAGMIAVMGGVALLACIVGGPRHGLIARRIRQRQLARTVAREDLLGALWRIEEGRAGEPAARPPAGAAGRSARREAIRAGEVESTVGGVRLTALGRERAREIIRAHRQWETYLVDELGHRPDHVHRTAEALEHVRTPGGERLAPDQSRSRDPHDREIP